LPPPCREIKAAALRRLGAEGLHGPAHGLAIERERAGVVLGLAGGADVGGIVLPEQVGGLRGLVADERRLREGLAVDGRALRPRHREVGLELLDDRGAGGRIRAGIEGAASARERAATTRRGATRPARRNPRSPGTARRNPRPPATARRNLRAARPARRGPRATRPARRNLRAATPARARGRIAARERAAGTTGRTATAARALARAGRPARSAPARGAAGRGIAVGRARIPGIVHDRVGLGRVDRRLLRVRATDDQRASNQPQQPGHGGRLARLAECGPSPFRSSVSLR
jgi:hypothetical protein